MPSSASKDLRRLALCLPLSATVAGCAIGQEVAGRGAGASYRVDDIVAVGTVADERLSLAEAIRLANGSLSEQALSDAERRQIARAGRPGATTISIVIGKGRTIRQDAALPSLERVDGLTLDGGGAVLLAQGELTKGKGLVVASSRVTIRDIAVLGHETPILIRPSAAGLAEDIAIAGVRVMPRNLGIHLLAQSKDWSGVLRRVSITDSTIDGPDAEMAKSLPFASANNGVRIEGYSSADGPGAGEIDGVTIARNSFGLALAEGVDMTGTSAASPADRESTAPRGIVRNVTVRGNRFSSCGDICVLGYGGMAVGKDAANGLLADLTVEDNEMLVKGNGLYVVGSYTLMKASTRHNLATRLVIRRNSVAPVPGGKCEGFGFALMGHSSDLADGAGEGMVRDVRITGNTVRGCPRGIALGGVKSGGTGKMTVEGAGVEQVRVTGNRLIDNEAGMEIVGASVFKGGLMKFRPAGQADSAIFRNNFVRDVRVEANSFSQAGENVIVAGASSSDVGAYTLSGNHVENVAVRFGNGAAKRACAVRSDLRQNSGATHDGNRTVGIRCR
jgi:hypothetical protein